MKLLIHSQTSTVWDWISYFIPHFIMNVFTYPCSIHVSKWSPRRNGAPFIWRYLWMVSLKTSLWQRTGDRRRDEWTMITFPNTNMHHQASFGEYMYMYMYILLYTLVPDVSWNMFITILKFITGHWRLKQRTCLTVGFWKAIRLLIIYSF